MILFFAITPESKLQKKIAQQTSTIRSLFNNTNIRWIEPENYHITLHYLGETNPTLLNTIILSMDGILNDLLPCPIDLSKPLLFPNDIKPKVIVLEVCLNEQLMLLQETIKKKMIEIGLPDKHHNKYKPHLTLAYFNDRKPIDLSLFNKQLNISFSCSQITLFESDKKKNSSVYTPLATF